MHACIVGPSDTPDANCKTYVIIEMGETANPNVLHPQISIDQKVRCGSCMRIRNFFFAPARPRTIIAATCRN
jgi:hypothetical protein